MQDIFDIVSRGWNDLLARPSGPYALRFVLQPLMAALLAVRDGIGDARTRRSPYFWRVMHDVGQRRERFVEALKATMKIAVLAVLIDAAYQLKVLRAFYADEALVVALALALAPYLLSAVRWIESPDGGSLAGHLRRTRRNTSRLRGTT